MANKIIGNFYFRRTANGNILGEYTNKGIKEVFAEIAIPKDKIDTFVGKYTTSWFEGNTEDPNTSELEIETKEDNKFRLTWKNANEELFYGEGFIVDNILIGFYTDGEF